MQNLKKLILSNLIVIGLAHAGLAGQMASLNNDYVITKDLFGATGTPSMVSQDFTLGFAWGEPISGDEITQAPYTIISGYYGGRFGNGQTFKLLSSIVGAAGTKTYFQDQLQVGVPFDAPIEITFADQVDSTTIHNGGVQVVIAADHLGRSTTITVPFAASADPVNNKITIRPDTAWVGNTLYDVQVTPELLNVDRFPLDQVYHIYFLTVLDPHQDNVVLNPIGPAAAAAAIGAPGGMSIQIPTASLSDYSTVLLSHDPLSAPLHADPKIIQEANEKARAAGGPYRVPVAIQEINAYNTQGNLMGALSAPAQISMDYGAGFSASAAASGLIRPQTLSLWILDETHRLWVKIPASQNSLGLHTVSAPVSQFSVFALMGSADGSSTDTFVFPVPWRPHGPNAGTGPGQTGTEDGGMTFANLPSECSIKIYTIAGDLVREMHHSDAVTLLPEEKWDGKTTHGEVVASGVYLWRVESSVDGKNGKLMIIR